MVWTRLRWRSQPSVWATADPSLFDALFDPSLRLINPSHYPDGRPYGLASLRQQRAFRLSTAFARLNVAWRAAVAQ